MKHRAIQHLFAVCTLIVAIVTSMFIMGEVALKTRSGSPTGMAILDSSRGEVNNIGFMTPYDIFDSTTAPIATLSVTPGSSTFTGQFSYNQAGGYVYDTYYVLRQGEWVAETMTRTNPTSPWIPTAAVDTFTGDYSDFLQFGGGQDDLYVAFYACKKHNDIWRCGCRTIDSALCNEVGEYNWSLQSYDLGSGQSGQYLEVIDAADPNRDREALVTTGSTVSFDIELNGFNAVYGYDYDITYDPAVLSNPVLSYGGVLGDPAQGYPDDTTNPVFLCLNEDTSVQGTISNIACTATGDAIPTQFGGSTVTQRVTFTVIGARGTYSQVNVVSSQVAEWPTVATDADGSDLPTTIETYQVNNAAVIVI